MHRGPASISFVSVQLGLRYVCPSCLTISPHPTRIAVLFAWRRDPNGGISFECMYHHPHGLAVAAARALRVVLNEEDTVLIMAKKHPYDLTILNSSVTL